jgi:hypothetical protein
LGADPQKEGDFEVHALTALKILREAGLIRSERHGVEMHNISRCTEVAQRFAGLIRAIVTAHTIQAAGEARAKMPIP